MCAHRTGAHVCLRAAGRTDGIHFFFRIGEFYFYFSFSPNFADGFLLSKLLFHKKKKKKKKEKYFNLFPFPSGMTRQNKKVGLTELWCPKVRGAQGGFDRETELGYKKRLSEIPLPKDCTSYHTVGHSMQPASRCTWMASSLLPTWLLTGISGKDTKVKKTFLFLLEAIRRHGGIYIQLHFSRPARKWVRFHSKLVPRAQLICWPFEYARNQNLLIEGAIFFSFFSHCARARASGSVPMLQG